MVLVIQLPVIAGICVYFPIIQIVVFFRKAQIYDNFCT